MPVYLVEGLRVALRVTFGGNVGVMVVKSSLLTDLGTGLRTRDFVVELIGLPDLTAFAGFRGVRLEPAGGPKILVKIVCP